MSKMMKKVIIGADEYGTQCDTKGYNGQINTQMDKEKGTGIS